jgi:hypothetical protein
VWIALAKNIRPGQTVTYGELAKMVNNPGLYLCSLIALSYNVIENQESSDSATEGLNRKVVQVTVPTVFGKCI